MPYKIDSYLDLPQNGEIIEINLGKIARDDFQKKLKELKEKVNTLYRKVRAYSFSSSSEESLCFGNVGNVALDLAIVKFQIEQSMRFRENRDLYNQLLQLKNKHLETVERMNNPQLFQHKSSDENIMVLIAIIVSLIFFVLNKGGDNEYCRTFFNQNRI